MNKLFYYLYAVVSMLLYLLAIPFLFILSFKTKYRTSIPARFFLWKNPPLKPDGIWFHSCSFGEAKAIKPLVDTIDASKLRMTSTTQTGFEVIKTYTEQSRYLPFETLLFTWIRPQKVLVVMEAEFWYLLFMLAQKRGAKTLLINARISERSFSKYQRVSWLYRQIFKHIDKVYAQTTVDKERLESLGATDVMVTGNIKLASLPKITKTLLKPKSLLVCAASTHHTEEELVLDAFFALKKERSDAKLILAPRHPERFDTVATLIKHYQKNQNFTWQRYTQKADFTNDITLLDTLGDLVNVYAISDIVILGGAFAPIGGHNAAEVAQFGCKIISGKHYFNQKYIFNAIEGIAIVEASNLSRRLLQHALLKPTKIILQSDIGDIVGNFSL